MVVGVFDIDVIDLSVDVDEIVMFVKFGGGLCVV